METLNSLLMSIRAWGTPGVYLLAFLGGIVLNAMPCVLPVLTMKVFHVVEQAKEDPKVNRKHGVAYSAGILLFFLIAGIVVLVAKSAGERLISGQQFQNPYFLGFMTTLMFVFGLNALGVFEFTVGTSVEGGSGLRGSFINGLVAAVMATPCTAPGIALVLPFAFSGETPAYHSLGALLMIGVGLALPFAIISFVPAVARILPKPGAWMATFKSLMGFTLMGAAIWLYFSLGAIVGHGEATFFLAWLLVVGIAVWAIPKWGGLEHDAGRRYGVRGGALAASAVMAFLLLDFSPKEKAADKPVAALEKETVNAAGVVEVEPVVVDGHIAWVDFDPKRIDAELARGRPVFMDFTADWCANCKTNEKLFIETDQVRGDLERSKILPMKADFTDEDEEIEEWIEKLGRAGIPIYVILTPDGERHLLPEVITTEMLSKALNEASAKFPPDKFKARDGETKTAVVAPEERPSVADAD